MIIYNKYRGRKFHIDPVVWWYQGSRSASLHCLLLFVCFFSSWSQDGCHSSKHPIIHNNIQRLDGKGKFTSSTSVLIKKENISPNSPRLSFTSHWPDRVARPHSTAAQTQSLTKGNRILRTVLDQTHHDSSSGAGSISPQSANPRMEMRFHYPRKKRDWLSVDHGHQRQIPPFAQGKS